MEIALKNSETEAVFTKRNINNEWNVNFHQNICSVKKKVSRLTLLFSKTDTRQWKFFQNTWCIKILERKLYSSRPQWTMNWTLIFNQIWYVSKNIEKEVVFTETEMTNEWNVNFPQNILKR